MVNSVHKMVAMRSSISLLVVGVLLLSATPVAGSVDNDRRTRGSINQSAEIVPAVAPLSGANAPLDCRLNWEQSQQSAAAVTTKSSTSAYLSGSDGRLQKIPLNAPDRSRTLGVGIRHGSAAVSWDGSRVDVFAVQADGSLGHQFEVAGQQSGWEQLGGYLTSSPAAISFSPGTLEVFARGGDNGLWTIRWTGTSWSGWSLVGGILTSGPGAAVDPDSGRARLGVRGMDGTLWEVLLRPDWQGVSFKPTGIPLCSTPAYAARSGDGESFTTAFSDNTGSVTVLSNGTTSLGGNVRGSVGLISIHPKGYVVLGISPDDGLWVFDARSGTGSWRRPPVDLNPMSEEWGEPVWRDEFDYRDRNGVPAIDRSKWNIRSRADLGLLWDAAIPEPGQVNVDESGVAHLRGDWLPAPVQRPKGASGPVLTHKTAYLDQRVLKPGNVSWGQRYGRWEIRAKVPTKVGDTYGALAAFWLRGSRPGEIDIMEAWGSGPVPRAGQRTGTSTTTIFSNTSTGADKKAWTLEQAAGITEPNWKDFHVWALEYTPNRFSMYYDGRHVFTTSPSETPVLWNPAYFDGPLHMRLNLHVGPSETYWGRPTYDHPEWSAGLDFQVDYVRVYKYTG